jgi:hypothetical protein
VRKCPNGEFARGFQLAYPTETMQDIQTGINYIVLICEGASFVQSHLTPNHIGSIYNQLLCPANKYLVGFQLKTTRAKLNPPTSGVTDMRMMCSDGTVIKDNRLDSFIMSGDWGLMNRCEHGHGIVGLQAQYGEYEKNQQFSRTSGLTNLNLACAKKSQG